MYSQSGNPKGHGPGFQSEGFPQQTMAQQQQPFMQQQPHMPQQPSMQQQPFMPGAQMPPPGFTQPQQPMPDPFAPDLLPLEQSYIENILRLNRGKVGTFYMTYEFNEKWNAKIFKGVVEAAGRDHIIISDPQTEKRYLLLMVNLDYVTFDQELEYEYPFNDVSPLATYPPR